MGLLIEAAEDHNIRSALGLTEKSQTDIWL